MNETTTPTTGGVTPEAEPASEAARLAQYQATISMVRANVRRLDRFNLSFFGLNLFLLVAFAAVVSFWDFRRGGEWSVIELRSLPLFLPITGMFASIIWVALCMRLQLDQRLHYFQLRWLERALGVFDGGMFSEASKYWTGSKVTSPDGAETLRFPDGGDGRIGKVPYRIWNWALPLWFFLLFFYLMVALYSALSSLALPAGM